MSEIVSQVDARVSRQAKIVFLIPVYNDWKSLLKLLEQLDGALENEEWTVEILAVDDGSEAGFEPSQLPANRFKCIRNFSVLELKKNLGHQRAIAVGLTFIEAEIKCDVVLVMDGDGEDTPVEAKRLIEKCFSENPKRIVFGRRAKRSENWQFRASYQIYKIIYKFLTGQEIRFGNFSAVPSRILSRLIAISEIWNHYAAAISKAKLPYTEIDTVRGVRLDGKSKMNFVSLVTHGLSAVSVYGEIIGIRLLISTGFFTVISVFLIALVVAVRLLTDTAVPGWATYVSSILVVILLQFITLSLFFSFLVLTGRNNAVFFPQNDYRNFIGRIYKVYDTSDEKSRTVRL